MGTTGVCSAYRGLLTSGKPAVAGLKSAMVLITRKKLVWRLMNIRVNINIIANRSKLD